MIEMGFMLAIELSLEETERFILAVEQGLPFDCANDGATMRVKDGVMFCERVVSNPDMSLQTTAELAAELASGSDEPTGTPQVPEFEPPYLTAETACW